MHKKYLVEFDGRGFTGLVEAGIRDAEAQAKSHAVKKVREQFPEEYDHMTDREIKQEMEVVDKEDRTRSI